MEEERESTDEQESSSGKAFQSLKRLLVRILDIATSEEESLEKWGPQEHQKHVLDLIPAAVFLTELSGGILTVNRSALHLFRLKNRAAIYGKSQPDRLQ